MKRTERKLTMKTIPDGVWPTMVTPFTDNNEIDYNGYCKHAQNPADFYF